MGGKGVSTAGGILFAFNPWIGLFGFIIWFICLFIYKYVSLSSIVCMVFVPILILLFNIDYANDPLCYTYLINKNILTWTNYPIYVITIIYAINSLLVIVRHQTNIARLINHTENKIGKKIK
jgi:glycerol-3-phosphate acyltransferase PlsY